MILLTLQAIYGQLCELASALRNDLAAQHDDYLSELLGIVEGLSKDLDDQGKVPGASSPQMDVDLSADSAHDATEL